MYKNIYTHNITFFSLSFHLWLRFNISRLICILFLSYWRKKDVMAKIRAKFIENKSKEAIIIAKLALVSS